MKKRQILRPAIAMLELVFSLIIIGIVLMSAPRLISTANKSGYVALQQEAISAAASEIGMILTYHWDEKDTDENLSTPILSTAGDANLNEQVDANNNPTGIRAGTSIFSQRSFLTSLSTRLSATAVNKLGKDTGDNNISDDIDDFDNTISQLNNVASTNSSKGDYVDTSLSISTRVTYLSDTLSAGNYLGIGVNTINFNINTQASPNTKTSNIKLIRVNLTTTNTLANITLYAFACNIGTYKLAQRQY